VKSLGAGKTFCEGGTSTWRRLEESREKNVDRQPSGADLEGTGGSRTGLLGCSSHQGGEKVGEAYENGSKARSGANAHFPVRLRMGGGEKPRNKMGGRGKVIKARNPVASGLEETDISGQTGNSAGEGGASGNGRRLEHLYLLENLDLVRVIPKCGGWKRGLSQGGGPKGDLTTL